MAVRLQWSAGCQGQLRSILLPQLTACELLIVHVMVHILFNSAVSHRSFVIGAAAAASPGVLSNQNSHLKLSIPTA